jgi:hypothetical protein
LNHNGHKGTKGSCWLSADATNHDGVDMNIQQRACTKNARRGAADAYISYLAAPYDRNFVSFVPLWFKNLPRSVHQ